jgi:hypothetical protein
MLTSVIKSDVTYVQYILALFDVKTMILNSVKQDFDIKLKGISLIGLVYATDGCTEKLYALFPDIIEILMNHVEPILHKQSWET